MNRFFGITMIVMAMFVTDECDEFLNGFLENSFADLASSQLEEDRAPKQAAVAAENHRRAQENRLQALTPGNLGRGENMNFDQINNAIDLSPKDNYLYFTKAAMQIAAGKDPSEAEGQALTATRRSEFYPPVSAEDRYVSAYIHVLADVAFKTPPGPGRDRILEKACPQLKRIWASGDNSYKDVPCP